MPNRATEIRGPEPVAPLPGNITAAAVVLLVFGALAGLGTILTLLAALVSGARDFNVYGDPGNFRGAMGGAWIGLLFVLLLAALGAAVTAGHVVAGWAILQRYSWGRILGLVVSGAALVVLVIGLASMLVWATVDMPPDDFPRRYGEYYRSVAGATLVIGAFVAVVLVAAYGFVLWVLARYGDAIG